MVQLPVEVVKLLEAAASHPEGEAPLFEGHLESIAALYQVHPERVEQLRDWVGQSGGRAAAVEIVERARLNPVLVQNVISPQPFEDDPVALIAHAAELPHGLELLTRGPIETAALLLGTHPFVVEAARLQLAARHNGGDT